MKTKTPKIHYSCKSCGSMSLKWLGRCPTCQEWNSFEEEKEAVEENPQHGATSVRLKFGSAPMGALPLEEVSEAESVMRLPTGFMELDRVLGGGLIPDSFILLGGDPGIGKSTLLLQAGSGMIANNPGLKILYVSGEESIQQIRARALRLGVASDHRFLIASETQLERVFDEFDKHKPDILFVDSLQTFTSQHSQSAAGSVSQLREITARLMSLAKSAHVSVWIIGHVTKDGSIAGPKMVEHMVDTVLYFEGESTQNYRLLRTVKNRYGSTNEIGVFEMNEIGLQEVLNPSSLFLTERKEAVSGTSVTASLEGSRPLLVELQSLVVPSGMAMPRRTAVGMDSSRVTLLSAILERHMGLKLNQSDLYFNVSGGLKLTEPAVDLGAVAAIWSAFENQPISSRVVWIGELSLTGETKQANSLEVRLQEAQKLGFRSAIVGGRYGGRNKLPQKWLKNSDIHLQWLEHVRDLPKLQIQED